MGKSKPSTARNIPSHGFLKLADPEFSAGAKEAASDGWSSDEGDRFRGLALDAPRMASDKDGTMRIPLAGFRSLPFSELGGFDFRKQTILVGRAMEDGSFAAARFFLPTRAWVAPPPAAPPEGEGVASEAEFSDAASVLALPWRSGEYVFWLIARGLRSKSVRIQVRSNSTMTAEKGPQPAVGVLLPFAAKPVPLALDPERPRTSRH